MALDPTNISEASVTVPAIDGQAVVNDVELAKYSRGLYIGVTGDVEVLFASGNTVLFTAVPAGQILPITVSKVIAANTTATNITAVY